MNKLFTLFTVGFIGGLLGAYLLALSTKVATNEKLFIDSTTPAPTEETQ